MSTDFEAACFTCETFMHLGQRFAGEDRLTFGLGSRDVAGQADLGRWLLVHLEAKHDVRLGEAPVEFKRVEFK